MTRPAFSSELHRTRSNEKAGGGGGGSQHVSVERGLKWLEPRDVARSIMNELALLPSAERRVDFGGRPIFAPTQFVFFFFSPQSLSLALFAVPCCVEISSAFFRWFELTR